METIRVTRKSDGRVCVINESDFDESVHAHLEKPAKMVSGAKNSSAPRSRLKKREFTE